MAHSLQTIVCLLQARHSPRILWTLIFLGLSSIVVSLDCPTISCCHYYYLLLSLSTSCIVRAFLHLHITLRPVVSYLYLTCISFYVARSHPS